jgi:hypothetical protein
MKANRVAVLVLSGLAAAVLLSSLNYAQQPPGEARRPDEDDARPVEIGEYEYVISSVLDEHLEEYVGKYVKIVDELAVLWDDPTPEDSKEVVDETHQKGFKGDYDNQTLQEKHDYLKFETYYFRYLLPGEQGKSADYLRWLNRRRTAEDPTQLRPEPKLVCVYGKVIRTTVWGRVAERGAEIGTKTEEIIIMAHRVERPSERFFKDLPNEED